MEETVVRDGIKSFGEIYCKDGGTGWGFPLVEAAGYGLGDGEEGGGGGSGLPESVLGLRKGEARLEEREHKTLEDLDCGGEEGNWSVGGA